MTVTIASILIAQPSSRRSAKTTRRKTTRRWCLAVLCGIAALSAVATQAAADIVAHGPETRATASLATGIKAARAGQFGDAITILGQHAEAGHVMAHYGLGLIYAKARGAALPARPNVAHRHFRAAARKGHVGSIFELAFQFERGIGTAADMKTALRFYRLAAHNNHLNAQFNLAVLLSRGGAVKPNPREAYFWALAAQHNARTRPQGALTFEKVTRLVRQIHSTLPHQAASQATRAATLLTGQPV